MTTQGASMDSIDQDQTVGKGENASNQLFSHASAEVRGKNTLEGKVTSTGDQTHNHLVTRLTR